MHYSWTDMQQIRLEILTRAGFGRIPNLFAPEPKSSTTLNYTDI